MYVFTVRSAVNSEVIKLELAGIDSGLLMKTNEDVQRSVSLISRNQIPIPRQVRIKKPNHMQFISPFSPLQAQ